MGVAVLQHHFVGQPFVYIYMLIAVALVGIGVLVFLPDVPWWRHVRELNRRTPFEPIELQTRFLPDIRIDVIERLLAIVEDQFGEDPRLVRPDDIHFLIHDDLDASPYIKEIEKTFGFTFTDAEIDTMTGTFGEIARHVTKSRRMV